MCRLCSLHRSAITPLALSSSQAELAARSLRCPQSALAHRGTAPTFIERINEHVKLGRGILWWGPRETGGLVSASVRGTYGVKEREETLRGWERGTKQNRNVPKASWAASKLSLWAPFPSKYRPSPACPLVYLRARWAQGNMKTFLTALVSAEVFQTSLP